MRSSLVTLALCLSAASAPAVAQDKPKQLVMISFDGAGANHLWQRSRDLGARANARFTYFLSCTLVIAKADARRYQGPHQKAGRSNIGFAMDKAEARDRLHHVWQARSEGHEIASHTCGHFDGKDWSAEDWATEFTTFRTVLRDAWKANAAAAEEPSGWQDFVKGEIRGFRAPYFSTSAGLVAALRRDGFTYDASLVTKGPAIPEEKDALVRFGLPLIPEGPSGRPIIGMDYNLFVRHSGGFDNPSKTSEFEARAYSAFRAAFEKEYAGDRIPLQLGFHFVEMNGGAYWRAMERLVTEVCGMDDVACVTYNEALRLIEDRKKMATSSGL